MSEFLYDIALSYSAGTIDENSTFLRSVLPSIS